MHKILAIFASALLLSLPLQAQDNVIDEVIWVVGEEAILKSDVEQARLESQSMGQRIDGDPYCVIPEQLAVQKLFLHQAAIDSVEVTDSEVLQDVERRVSYYIQQIGSKEKMEEVLDSGFVALQMARALVNDTDFINKLQRGEVTRSECKHSNYCIGRMYTLEMKCHHCVENMPKQLQKEIDKAERTL